MTDDRLTTFGNLYGTTEPKRRLYDKETWRSHFSGYAASDFPGSLHTSIGFYVHGQKGAGGHAPEDPERTRELGMPISGDEIARFSRWWARDMPFPYYGDVPGIATHHGSWGNAQLLEDEPKKPAAVQLTLF